MVELSKTGRTLTTLVKCVVSHRFSISLIRIYHIIARLCCLLAVALFHYFVNTCCVLARRWNGFFLMLIHVHFIVLICSADRLKFSVIVTI